MSAGAASVPGMTIIEEHRSKLRVGENTLSIEIVTVPGGERCDRLVVSVAASGPDGERRAEGQLEVSPEVAGALGGVLSETLRHHGAMSEPGGGRSRDRPAGRGRPWTAEQDAELERRWISGEDVATIAARFERTPGGIRARLPRVGCDPQRPGEYLPEPPSRRESG
jgi:hypothetical protein